jgi:hypothetical protein
MAIRELLQKVLRGEQAAGTGLVFDHDRRAERLGKLPSDGPRGDICWSTRRKTHEQTDRTRWIVLGVCRADAAEQRGDSHPSQSCGHRSGNGRRQASAPS